MDETHTAAATLLGAQIRVGGTAELAGYTLKLHEARRQTLTHVASDLFSEGGDAVRAEFWCGPTPTPISSAARGHGSSGWTIAAGTARVMADVMSARGAGIDLAGLRIDRYACDVLKAAAQPASPKAVAGASGQW